MTVDENIIVLKRGPLYQAMTDITHDKVHESNSAQAAIQHAIDSLADAGGEVTLGRGVFVLDGPVALADNV